MILGNLNHPNRIPNPVFWCMCVCDVRYYFQTFCFVEVFFLCVWVFSFILFVFKMSSFMIFILRINACVFGIKLVIGAARR